VKNKGLFIGLGILGVLAFYGSPKASAATTPLVPPTPPTPPPPPPPVAKPKPKPKVDVSIGPAIIDSPVPAGWIAARPTPELDKVRSDVKATLGDSPVGTKFPFQMNDKKYLAIVLPGGEVGILQPELQI
jgi:hypothetical protein